MESIDSLQQKILIGDEIKVLKIDERITEYLPDEEKEVLASFIDNVFQVEEINSDGSMVVSRSWEHPELGEISGQSVAIFPEGALKV